MTRNEFLENLGHYYEVEKEGQDDRLIKYETIVERTKIYNYNYDRIWISLTEHEYYGFPEWAVIKSIFRNNKIIDKPVLKLDRGGDKKPGINGDWICRGCQKRRNYYNEMYIKHGIQTIEKDPCPICGFLPGRDKKKDGAGYSEGNMVWEYYISQEKLREKIKKFKDEMGFDKKDNIIDQMLVNRM